MAYSKNLKQVQSFLGFTNFYQCFVFHYSDIIVPLTCLTCKHTPWDWNSKADTVFCTLKQAFTEAPVLMHWLLDTPVLVETNALDYTLAGIISISPDGETHPIAFHSHTFTDTKWNYNTHDKELLAIFKCFKIWHHYLEGSQH